ncbi:MAG: hypothetical protein H0T79_08735, partial [Deltaproteobacteria bacterium]|nr:hypothetical protein [Deltaproteobacteria bacterium]
MAMLVGGLTLAAYVAQAQLGLVWPWLVSLQADDTYKVGSGLVLSGYLIFQWSVASRRQWDPGGALWRHKLGGALAPVVLYLHASRFAYGYLLLLALAYLITAFVGLLNRPILK